MSVASSAKLLKTVLVLDAATCLAFGVLLTLGADLLGEWFGLPSNLLLIAGVILFPCAVLMYVTGRQETPSPALVWLIIIGNVGWVIASIAILLLPAISPSLLGFGFVIVQALAVCLLAGLEYRMLASTGKLATA
ncbi:hypothetical protein [Thalassospira lucentensis]|mgnify:FL=1|uniref:hypothetical protein n=1 Tax=Thalassospira lucentensis TaxID=168935 RepID=UPI003D282AAB